MKTRPESHGVRENTTVFEGRQPAALSRCCKEGRSE